MEVCTIVFTNEHPNFEEIVQDAKSKFFDGVAGLSCKNEFEEVLRLQEILKEHGIEF